MNFNPWLKITCIRDQKLSCQGGVPWDGCDIPDDYEFELVFHNGTATPYSQVSASEDSRICAALLWVYNWYVNKMPGNEIVAMEETVYFVHKKSLSTGPEWSAQLTVFSVWEQEHQMINFRLRNQNLTA